MKEDSDLQEFKTPESLLTPTTPSFKSEEAANGVLPYDEQSLNFEPLIPPVKAVPPAKPKRTYEHQVLSPSSTCIYLFD